MRNYSYPAIFTPEENGSYSVYFPDFEGCYTCGDDMADSIYMAQDVLAFTLCSMEKEGKTLPIPSTIESLVLSGNETVNFIACDNSVNHPVSQTT